VSANVFGRYLTDFNVEKLDKEVTDYIVVGSGIAGLYTALKLSEHGKVLIFTKRGNLELKEKFNLPSVILESGAFNRLQSEGRENPFEQDAIVICSTHFAHRKKNELYLVPWDLVVIDEAHKLRNAYRPSNKIGRAIKWALRDRRKILLTATPLQNSLLELYGLATVIDEHIFGDRTAFRNEYMGNEGDLEKLKTRLQGFCKRTLRRQVLEYIRYTERLPITRTFRPTNLEQELYIAISEFLQREDTYSIPNRQRTLTTLVLRKLLSSSTRAVIGTLETIKERLELLREGAVTSSSMLEILIGVDEIEPDILDETDDLDESDDSSSYPSKIDLNKLDAEILELQRYIDWARSIGVDTKTKALMSAIEIGFEKMQEIGAQRKALIFTESRRTQDYLKEYLENNGYANRIVILNGTNTDPEANAIYDQWIKTNVNTGRITGSRTVDKRIAIIEYFRDAADIMIATESGAEGVNLQFCSLVINYDLPWNPQRIEQRIGRCHRYGQKHDVVVVNFLNARNAADRRVYELLVDKFKLFSGVLGASDEVLGSIESGVDFEKRILSIYQKCRTSQEIELAFKKLQDEMEQSIRDRMAQTQQTLLENFDEDVHARLKMNLEDTRYHLDRVSKFFWELTRVVLKDYARFDDDTLAFALYESPIKGMPRGTYRLISKSKRNADGVFLYRISHPLGEYAVAEGKSYDTPPAHVVFDISHYPTKISVVEGLKGKSGYLILCKLTVDSFDRDEYLLFNAYTSDGETLDQEICERLFYCRGKIGSFRVIPKEIRERLDKDSERHASATISRVLEENNKHFQEARERLESWADDLILAAAWHTVS
jgi:superfamily II DNA or RNA helicase